MKIDGGVNCKVASTREEGRKRPKKEEKKEKEKKSVCVKELSDLGIVK